MSFKIVSFAALLAVASAGLAPSYPGASYQTQAAYPAPAYQTAAYPAQTYQAAAYPAPAYQAAAYAAPAYQAQPAYTKIASPAYSAPIAKFAAPVYAAPVARVAAPVYAKVAAPEPYDAHPQYNFAYDIHDEHTGDVKSQQETRDGDVVKGYYSFIESDGARRVVEYTADPEHGFNAVVRREQGAAHPTGPVAKVAAPVYAAPAAKIAAPVYSAPVAKYAASVYAAPVAKFAAPLYSAPVGKVAAPSYYH